MKLNQNVELYKLKSEYDPILNDNVEEREFVNKTNAQVEELTGNQYYREYGVFKRGAIKVTVLQSPLDFTHINYDGRDFKVIDLVKVRNRTYVTAEEV